MTLNLPDALCRCVLGRAIIQEYEGAHAWPATVGCLSRVGLFANSFVETCSLTERALPRRRQTGDLRTVGPTVHGPRRPLRGMRRTRTRARRVAVAIPRRCLSASLVLDAVACPCYIGGGGATFLLTSDVEAAALGHAMASALRGEGHAGKSDRRGARAPSAMVRSTFHLAGGWRVQSGRRAIKVGAGRLTCARRSTVAGGTPTQTEPKGPDVTALALGFTRPRTRREPGVRGRGDALPGIRRPDKPARSGSFCRGH